MLIPLEPKISRSFVNKHFQAFLTKNSIGSVSLLMNLIPRLCNVGVSETKEDLGNLILEIPSAGWNSLHPASDCLALVDPLNFLIPFSRYDFVMFRTALLYARCTVLFSQALICTAITITI